MPTFNLPVEFFYVIASMVVAVGIILQGWFLNKTNGKMPENNLFYVCSLLEMVWILISGLSLYFLEFDNLAICVPVGYLVYGFLSFFYGAKTINSETLPSSLDDIAISQQYISFCQSFAVVFLGLCAGVLYFSFNLLQ